MLDHPSSHAAASGETWFGGAAADARAASRFLAQSKDAIRSFALRAAAAQLRRRNPDILAANEQDLELFKGTEAFRDRLVLDPARIDAMAVGLELVADLPDPLNRVLESWTRPNGLEISRVASPIGVIGMIYESRPNVGVDAAGLCIKSGNAVILRGGSESHATSQALGGAISDALREAGLPSAAVQTVPMADRSVVAAMLAGHGQLDLLIPRGGKSLVERVQGEARVPVLAHAEGLCHTYIDEAARLEMALEVLANAKLRRPGICSATETLLVDSTVAKTWLPVVLERMRSLGCTFRGDIRVREIAPSVPLATEDDFRTEWQDAVLSVAIVNGVDGAISHINRYGSGHTDAIVTEDGRVAARFLSEVDSAVTLWNASTQFSDGGEFGFGAEIGISTGRLHARGPIGAAQLTTARYIVVGTGQTRS